MTRTDQAGRTHRLDLAPRAPARRVRVGGRSGLAGLGGLPLHAWLVVLSLVLGLMSGMWDRVGVPLPLDRLALVASVVSYGFSNAPGAGPPRTRRVVHAVMLAASVHAVLSAVVVGTLLDRYGLFALLDRLVMPFVLFLYLPLALATPLARRLLVVALMLTGLYLGATAILSMTGPTSLLFPSYIGEDVIGRSLGRARGPSGEPVGTGLVMIACAAAACLCVVTLRGAWRVVAGVSAAMCLAAVLLSMTRSIWLGGVLALLAIGLAVPGVRRRLPFVLAGGIALVAGFLALVPSVGAAAAARFGTQRSLDDRAYTNEAALRLFLDHPWTGSGWARFVVVGRDYVWQHDLGPITTVDIEVHNVWLSRAAELGLPGLLLFGVAVVLGPVRAVLLSSRRPAGPDDQVELRVLALAVAVSWLAVGLFTGLSYALPNLLAWGVSGLAVSQLAAGRPPSPRREVTPT